MSASPKENNMSQVMILPDELANQIAAGEVVERPMSVVKELVENSIDAGAARILIEIEQGGKKLIRVTDNGSGMSLCDAQLSFSRHATSKIISSADLERIVSLGFRGEALPSIASVSQMRMVTSDDEHRGGTQVVVEGGGPAQVKDVACLDLDGSVWSNLESLQSCREIPDHIVRPWFLPTGHLRPAPCL